MYAFVCVCICICVCLCICVYILYICICVHMCIYKNVCIYMYVYMYVCLCVTCMRIYICEYVYICVCMFFACHNIHAEVRRELSRPSLLILPCRSWGLNAVAGPQSLQSVQLPVEPSCPDPLLTLNAKFPK